MMLTTGIIGGSDFRQDTRRLFHKEKEMDALSAFVSTDDLDKKCTLHSLPCAG